MPPSDQPLQLGTARLRLATARGPDYWRTLEELAGTGELQDYLNGEFPRQAGLFEAHVDRRQFLGLLGASLALAGLAGCGPSQAPPERIMPYVRQPENVVPGSPRYFATAMPLAGYALGGLLVESHLCRPTKIEGNPDHPASPPPSVTPRGALFGPSDLFAQASILGLYDPDRSQTVRHLANSSAWASFRAALESAVLRRPRETLRLRLLTGTVTSPTLAHVLRGVLRQYPQARWHQWEPAGDSNALQGARLAFGRDVATQYRFDRARRILALDADFLSAGPLRYRRDYSEARRVWTDDRPRMNRLYVVESTLTNTGARADHRIALRPSFIEPFARSVAALLGIDAGPTLPDADFPLPSGFLQALVQDLRVHEGQSIVFAGPGQAPAVHALCHAINDRLRNRDTVIHTRPVAVAPSADEGAHDQLASLRRLTDEMDAGQVDALFILGGNPVYSTPGDLRFAQRLDRVSFRVHLSPYFDETSAHCQWHIPEAHYLESWGDVRSHDGTVTILQPLIAPLYHGRTALELLSLLTSQTGATSESIVHNYWSHVYDQAEAVRDDLPGFANLQRTGGFETWWRRALHAGFIAGSHSPAVADLPSVRTDLPRAQVSERIEVGFRTDPSVFDGSFANNGWLQELPRPISKITWDNVAAISPALALELGLATSVERAYEANGKQLSLHSAGTEVVVPVWVMPSHADGCITLTLGYGRSRAGRVGDGVGYNANLLRTSTSPTFASGVRAEPTGGRVQLASTQHHHLMDPRELRQRADVRIGELVRSATLADYEHVLEEALTHRPARLTLYPEPHETLTHENQWGMAIDLTVCTGCQACVIACQSENNIPVVGREEVARGRELHWLRIDHYFRGDPARPGNLETHLQPVLCMHCENAPCELVCPVEATAHSSDGLNDMVYNRCVGTRYCSNNCPYKVRRFNFLQYADFTNEAQSAMRNPDVTVRSRGVMEKCTYCVQRIRKGQIRAQIEDRPLADGEVLTACQSACPAGAIVFGDLRREGSVVRRMQGHPLNYGLLAELNTQPRTTYLPEFKNPNERLQAPLGRRE